MPAAQQASWCFVLEANFMARMYTRGLVLRLDPVTLRQQGARCTQEFESLGSAQHDFVCIEADAQGGWWLPLSPTPDVGCKVIAAEAKSGDRRWADVPSCYQPDQCWQATHKAVKLAAAAAHDRTDSKNANMIATEALPAPGDFPELGA